MTESTEPQSPSPGSTGSQISQVAKAKAEFQRELYKTADTRVANLDQQSTILIAAAVAIAGYTAGATSAGKVSTSFLIATSILAGLSIMESLHARFNHPWFIGQNHAKMQLARKLAAESCIKLQRLENSIDAHLAYTEVFNTWLALSNSSDRRREEKQKIYLIAIALLLLELGSLILGITAANNETLSLYGRLIYTIILDWIYLY